MRDRAAAVKAVLEKTTEHDHRAAADDDSARARQALNAWRALVEGELLLVDYFDHHGRRFLVARSCKDGTQVCKAMTLREREVLAYAVRGHSNKLIAYELCIPQSTVSTTLRAVAMRLGARSRLELVRILAVDRSSSRA